MVNLQDDRKKQKLFLNLQFYVFVHKMMIKEELKFSSRQLSTRG